MIKTTSALKRKIIETEKLQLITNSMHLHSLLRIDKLLKQIKSGVIAHEYALALFDNVINNPKIDIQNIIRPKMGATRKLVIVFSSDKGFAGEYNKKLLNESKIFDNDDCDYLIFGNKFKKEGINILDNEHNLEDLFADDQKIKDLVSFIIDKHFDGTYLSVSLVFNNYQNTSEYTTEVKQILPVLTLEKIDNTKIYSDFIIEGDLDLFYFSFLKKILYFVLKISILSSLTTETVQRNMITKGSKDKLEEKMTELKINRFKLRSEKITSETNDINNGILLKRKKESELENSI